MKLLLRNILAGLICSASILGAGSAFGQAGNLDTTFGKGGVTIISFAGAGSVSPDYIKLQRDGKILVLVRDGNVGHGVLRFTTSGVLDTIFGSNGVAGLSPSFGTSSSLDLQPNGQIVIAGVVSSSSGAALGVERLNSNGTPDTFFGSNGLATASLGNRLANGLSEVVLVQPNGFILVGTRLARIHSGQPSQTMLARFNSVGVLDPTFGTQGIVVATGSGGCTALAQLSNGGYLVVNAPQAVAEFTASGNVASTVTPGTLVASNGSNLPPSVFQPNGNFLFGADLFDSHTHVTFSAEVLRFTETGGADATFANPTFHYSDTGGTGIQAQVRGLAVQSNGDIVVVGNQVTFVQGGATTVNGLARLTPNGNFDPTFGSGGTVVNSVPAGTDGLFGVVIQANGNIITVGTAHNFTELTLTRYLGN